MLFNTTNYYPIFQPTTNNQHTDTLIHSIIQSQLIRLRIQIEYCVQSIHWIPFVMQSRDMGDTYMNKHLLAYILDMIWDFPI